MPDPGTIQWPPHPSMLKSVVIVMVVLGNVKGIPWDKWCLFDYQSKDLVLQPGGCVSPSLFQVLLDGSHVEVGIFH